MPEPKFFVSSNDGGKKPDLLSTEGSGCENLVNRKSVYHKFL